MLIQDLSSHKRKVFLSLVKKRVQPGSGSGLDFLHKRTWSYSVSNLNLILTQAPFVIVGGVATRLYMPERMTLDIDILIKTKDAKKICKRSGVIKKMSYMKLDEIVMKTWV